MRYALYFSPDPGSDLAGLGASWMGRDAATGAVVDHPVLDGLGTEELAAIAHSPRRYGFHATLKAPFRLAEGVGETRLLDAMARFTAQTTAFNIPSLTIGELDGFVALVPGQASVEINAFANSVVEFFEPLRAPLSEPEIQRRKPDQLTAPERTNLMRWGYPYVFDCFRFHMTLSTRLREPTLSRVCAAAEQHFAPALERPIAVSALSLFVEAEAGAPFRIRSRAALVSDEQRKMA